jgi:hypothetical protein
MENRISVYKRDAFGNPVWDYEAEIVQRGETWICVAAFFDHDDVDTGVVTFRRGDRMTEWFYNDRWYNVFKLEDVEDHSLKGWYCNITYPAMITTDSVTWDDLALDVFVSPDYVVTLLDEDEFNALNLSDHVRTAALAAVEALRQLVAQQQPPFD